MCESVNCSFFELYFSLLLSWLRVARGYFAFIFAFQFAALLEKYSFSSLVWTLFDFWQVAKYWIRNLYSRLPTRFISHLISNSFSHSHPIHRCALIAMFRHFHLKSAIFFNGPSFSDFQDWCFLFRRPAIVCAFLLFLMSMIIICVLFPLLFYFVLWLFCLIIIVNYNWFTIVCRLDRFIFGCWTKKLMKSNSKRHTFYSLARQKPQIIALCDYFICSSQIVYDGLIQKKKSPTSLCTNRLSCRENKNTEWLHIKRIHSYLDEIKMFLYSLLLLLYFSFRLLLSFLCSSCIFVIVSTYVGSPWLFFLV